MCAYLAEVWLALDDIEKARRAVEDGLNINHSNGKLLRLAEDISVQVCTTMPQKKVQYFTTSYISIIKNCILISNVPIHMYLYMYMMYMVDNFSFFSN